MNHRPTQRAEAEAKPKEKSKSVGDEKLFGAQDATNETGDERDDKGEERESFCSGSWRVHGCACNFAASAGGTSPGWALWLSCSARM